MAFSPDGQRLASAGRTWKLKVWDAATGQAIDTFKGGNAVAFSPDGRRLAVDTGLGQIKVWDAVTGQEISAHQGEPSA